MTIRPVRVLLRSVALIAILDVLFGCFEPVSCDGDFLNSCDDEDADGFEDCDADCDDGNPDVNPAAVEVCNGVDDNCDGAMDNDALDPLSWPRDADGDGYGNDAARINSCDRPAGYASNIDDCDDGDATAHPGGVEVCDGADNDCDGEVDNAVSDPPTWYADADGDGHGDVAVSVAACEAPVGYLAAGDDCDDTTAARAPGLPEACGSGVDEDCVEKTPDSCTYALGDAMAVSLGGALGAHTEEAAGAAVANAGDLDDDGFADVLVGGAGPGAAPAGAFVVMGPVGSVSSLADAAAHLETGIDADFAGAAVSGGGDVDGDGHADVLFGAPGAIADTTLPGTAWLMYGPDFAACSPFCDGAAFVGETPGDQLGASVALVGDTDGDGLDDVLVGEPRHAGGGGAALFVNAPSGNVAVMDADARWAGDGSGTAGSTVFAAGDVDDDGFDDLGVVDTSGARVWLLAGRSSGALLLADAAVRATTPVGDGTLASVVVDDLDGDGTQDLLSSAVRDSTQAADVVAWGALGPLAGTIELGGDVTVSTDGLYANAGVRVVSLGDVDFDGSADLVFSAPGARALLPPEYTVILELGDAIWTRPGPLAGTASLGDATTRYAAGQTLLPFPAGDINGDLRSDLLLGAPQDDSAAPDAGAFWAWSGDTLF